MSHEVMSCSGCKNPFKEHLMNHTETGSYCDACYKKLGLQKSAPVFEVCPSCKKQYMEGALKFGGVCKNCHDVEMRAKDPMIDVPFLSDENQARDIVLGFIHDEKNKRVGMRVLDRQLNRVWSEPMKDYLRAWNLNINQGRLDAKCSLISQFPVLTLPAGVVGNPMDPTAKLTSKVSGAWVFERTADGVFRLVSVSGQFKDVTEETALAFHEKYMLANATVVDGRLSGSFKRNEKDFGGDMFTLHEDGRVEWIYYNEDGNDGDGQYVVNNFDVSTIEEASKSGSLVEFWDVLGQLSRQYLIDNDGTPDFETTRKSVTTDKYDLVGCSDATAKELKSFAARLGTPVPKSKFIVDLETAHVEWLSKYSGYILVRMFYLKKAPTLLSGHLSAVEYFKTLAHELETNTYAQTIQLNQGDEDYEMLVKRFDTVSASYEGETEATKSELVRLASGAVAPKVDKSTAPSKEELEAMKALNDELKAACKAYYDEDDSPLTDFEYDQKFDALLALEHKTGYVLPDSVTQGVGTEISGKLPKVTHEDKLLSLDKTKNVGALKDLVSQDPNGDEGVLSWKKDGLTILATYEGGVLKQAVTRGNGKIGEDVTHNAKFFKGMPRRIPYTGKLKIRGEAVIAYSTFERINASLPEGQEPYKNPRNLASGMVRRSEVTKDGSVEFFPFGVTVDDPKFKHSQYGQSLKFLAGQGFNPVFYVTCTADGLEAAVEGFKKKIETFDYPTDGLVFCIDDVSVYEKLGSTGHHPRGAIAFKWADEKAKTILREIEWSASRTGVLTPVAIFDPVELEGTTVKRASVHNLTQLRKLKLGIGDQISIFKANMIIPQIAENHTKSDTCQPPKQCPVCGGATDTRIGPSVTSLVEPSEFLICTNPDCVAKNVGMLVHFVKRDAMNIDGISEKSVSELVTAGFIGKAADFYNLKNRPEIAKLPGWGKSSYSKLIYAVDNSRTPRLANFIYALGIRNVGRSASDTLAKHFMNLDAFLGASQADILQVEGIGAGMTADIVDYLAKHVDTVRELAGYLSIVNPDQEGAKTVAIPAGVEQGAPNCLDGLAFCVTGKIEFPGARDALAAYIESLGGRMASSVSKNTHYLITNTPNSGSSKNQAAQKLGCKIISENSFFLLVKDLSEKVAPVQEEVVVQAKSSEKPVLCEVCRYGEVVYSLNMFNIEDIQEYVSAKLGGVPLMYERLDNSHYMLFSQSEDVEYDVYFNDAALHNPEVRDEVMQDAKKEATHGEKVVQQMIESVEIPEDPREARIQVAGAIQALSGVPLAGLTICVTGKVNYGTRQDIHNYIERNGGKVASSVTKGVDYLVTEAPFSGSSKNKAAQAVGCHVISEDAFMDMVRTGKRPNDYDLSNKPADPYVKQTQGTVVGKTFCITGRVNYPGKRAALQSYISRLGGYNADNIYYGVDYLITNDPFSGSTKNREAKAIGCKVITEEQFMEMANQ